MPSSTDPDMRAALEAIDDLLLEWEEILESGPDKLRPRREKLIPQVALVMAFAVHVKECAKELRPVLPDRLTPVHVPILRAMYETTLRLRWVDHHEDGARAFMNEEIRQRRNLRQSMRDAPSLREFANRVAVADLPTEPTDLDAEARYVQAMLGGSGNDLYVAYRMLCAYSHPSVMLADSYLEGDDPNVTFSVIGFARPHMHNHNTWLVAVCLTWATRVVLHYRPDNEMRNRVRRHARALGVAPDL